MTTGRVKNWSAFQHYKDRSPPWIKLHRGILDNYEYACLPLASKALAPLIWLLAAESNDGSVRVDADWLAFRLRWDVNDVRLGLKPLIDNGFIEVDSDVLAPRKQDATPETETETEKAMSPAAPAADAAEPVSGDVVEVFRHWQSVMKHPTAKLDDKRKRLIRARLKDGYTPEQLRAAIDGCASSQFHMGKNDRSTVYDGLDLILRDGAKVDTFIAMQGKPAEQPFQPETWQ